jgi:hypothetical protein
MTTSSATNPHDWHDDMTALDVKVRGPITASINISATLDAMWQVISAPGNLQRCHPFCRYTE